jgi:hypothetical protein
VSSLLKFLPPQLVVTAEPLILQGLKPEQRLLCMLAVFLLDFADIESQILRRLIKFSKVSDEVGKAIFSGTKADAAMGLLLRLLEVSTETEGNKERYRKAFTQFKAITEIRNSILHYGIEKSSDSLITTNKRMALTQSRLRSYQISVETLENLVQDLGRIDAMLKVSAVFRNMKDQDLPSDWEIYLKTFREPWLYKRLQAQSQKSEKRTGQDRKKGKAPKGQR